MKRQNGSLLKIHTIKNYCSMIEGFVMISQKKSQIIT